jgi:glycosyltransferase involved in cell wall biosynthesis
LRRAQHADMNAAEIPDIVVDSFPAAQQSLRVAVVTETYPPEVNGVAMTIARVVEGLQRRNHQVQLVRPRQTTADGGRRDTADGTRFHEVLLRGLPIPRYPHLRMGVPSKKALVQLWSRARPDVVHVATEGPLGWSALQAARHLQLPLTSDFRTNFHAYSRHYGVGWLRKPIMAYLRKFHNACALTMVPTEPLRQELQAAGFRHVAVVARGVDTRLFNPGRRSDELRRSWGVGEHDLVVACVGRLAAEKNLGVLLQAYAAIRRDDAGARLLLVGEGPLRAHLVQQAPQAIFAGQRLGEDLAAHYASADLFLFPSLTETFGNVTTEAMASGLPVVAYDYAAAAQLMRPGESGVLVPMADAGAFELAAVQLARSRARRQALGTQARARALQQDWDDVLLRFEAHLTQAIQRQVQPARAVVHAPSAV